MKKILVIGSTVADVIINVDYLPSTAEDVHVKNQVVSLGGCAYNVSDMVRHFDAPYTLFSPIGTGIYGDFIRKEFAARDLVSPIPTPDMDNGCCYCFVEESGERTFISNHGAEYLFQKEWFDSLSTENIESIYICGLEIEEVTGPIVVDFLEEHREIPLFFAPGPRITRIDEKLMNRIMALHPVIHLNEDEACVYTGETTIEAAAKALYAISKNTVIVTNGENGAYYYDGSEFVHVPPVPVTEIVDTIGAGDGHIGAVMACLSKGMNLYDAIYKANKASSVVVATKGALISDEDFAQLEI